MRSKAVFPTQFALQERPVRSTSRILPIDRFNFRVRLRKAKLHSSLLPKYFNFSSKSSGSVGPIIETGKITTKNLCQALIGRDGRYLVSFSLFPLLPSSIQQHQDLKRNTHSIGGSLTLTFLLFIFSIQLLF